MNQFSKIQILYDKIHNLHFSIKSQTFLEKIKNISQKYLMNISYKSTSFLKLISGRSFMHQPVVYNFYNSEIECQKEKV